MVIVEYGLSGETGTTTTLINPSGRWLRLDVAYTLKDYFHVIASANIHFSGTEVILNDRWAVSANLPYALSESSASIEVTRVYGLRLQ